MSAVTPIVQRSRSLTTRALRGTLHAGYVASVIVSSVLASVGFLLEIGLDRVSAARS
ncbi:hypothetical protein [Rathayibacter sp. SD072]|uniref:hypothetical protein n=1 Tax=Rathayibacter sp. SD072 TaxID=2781731 RepID=UPI001A95AE41|nr:hypothetical protein [Rathayibacter sp. SD072]MBO0982597.1 hypothetical protein [Rathayibacter sp. SD072]